MYEEMKMNKKCIPKKFQRWTAEDEAELKQLKGKVDIKDTALGKRKQHLEDVTVTSTSEESELGSLLETLWNRGQDGADFIADMMEKAKAILASNTVDKNAVNKNAVDTHFVPAAPPKTVEVSTAGHSDDSTVSIIPPWEANP